MPLNVETYLRKLHTNDSVRANAWMHSPTTPRSSNQAVSGRWPLSSRRRCPSRLRDSRLNSRCRCQGQAHRLSLRPPVIESDASDYRWSAEKRDYFSDCPDMIRNTSFHRRRHDIRMVRFWRSTHDVEMCHPSDGAIAEDKLTAVVTATAMSARPRNSYLG